MDAPETEVFIGKGIGGLVEILLSNYCLPINLFLFQSTTLTDQERPFGWNSDPCVERGATIGYNAQAHIEAQKATRVGDYRA